MPHSWDDWVSHDRLRKLTEENKELAAALKKELDAQRQQMAATSKKGAGAKKKSAAAARAASDISSVRGSEEPHSAGHSAAGPRGQKRGRESDAEKVSGERFPSVESSASARELRAQKRQRRREASEGPSGGLADKSSLAEPRKARDDGKGVGNNDPVPSRRLSPIQEQEEKAGSPRKRPAPPGSEGGEEERESKRPRRDRRLPARYAADLADAASTTTVAPKAKPGAEAGPGGQAPPAPQPAARTARVKVTSGGNASGRRRPVGSKGFRGFDYRVVAGLDPSHPLHRLVTDPGASEPQEESFVARPSVRMVVPDHVKSILVDDWENVTKNLHLVSLPCEHTVNKILDAYHEHEKENRRPGSPDADLLDEFVQGLREYFELALGKILLYRLERDQFFQVREWWENPTAEHEGVKGPADVYGAEHLARLFGKFFPPRSYAGRGLSDTKPNLVNMPELISETNMDPQSVRRLREEVVHVTQWLAKRSDTYFVADYEHATQDYLKAIRGD